MRIFLLSPVLAILAATVPNALVTGQVATCLDPCFLESNLTCQEWIDSKTNWGGTCCSFADVTDDSDTVAKCRLTIAGSDGWCGWRTPEFECLPNATECTYAGEQLTVFDSNTTCPESAYDPFAATDNATTTPPPENNVSPPPATNQTDDDSNNATTSSNSPTVSPGGGSEGDVPTKEPAPSSSFAAVQSRRWISNQRFSALAGAVVLMAAVIL
jgi:hypothetical protein